MVGGCQGFYLHLFYIDFSTGRFLSHYPKKSTSMSTSSWDMTAHCGKPWQESGLPSPLMALNWHVLPSWCGLLPPAPVLHQMASLHWCAHGSMHQLWMRISYATSGNLSSMICQYFIHSKYSTASKPSPVKS